VSGFDVCGPLPSGVTVLEASAGTGKTFTIAALATRYVAEGVPLDKLLVVTFTRMATSELRERVRERLVKAERAFEEGPKPGDRLAELLVSEDAFARRARLARAVADFDAATITTTHGFCLEALDSLGFSGDVERDCTFVEDVTDLIDEVVDDLYVRRFLDNDVLLSYDQARAIAREAIKNPKAFIEPSDAPPTSYAAMRARLAAKAREVLDERKRHTSVMTYDDLLTRLDDALIDDDGTVAARLRDRYRVVLVDEFQDTDPVQWDIMRRAFGEGTLVLIGDPKQAIYAFRGADVYAYIEAARSSAQCETLGVNWRSDQRLLDAYDQLFGAAQLGHPEIVYRSTQAEHQQPRLTGAPVDAALRVRIVDRTSVPQTKTGLARKPDAVRLIARDLAEDVVALLSSDARVEGRDVRPGDIAVLVRINRNAAAIRDALEAAGVPAVINGAGSVFASDAARDWLALLEALERPSAPARAHALALTAFVGWPASRVACASDEEWESVHQRLHQWAYVLRTRGVASLLETITLHERLPERVLAFDDGERDLTDLRHVGQLLHAAATSEHLGAAALTAWLRRRIEQAEQDVDEERSRRLDSDAAAVQVLTIHRSKGLEFPIVYDPYLWDRSWIPDKEEPVFFHDAEHGDRRTLDVGLEGAKYIAHRRQHVRELRGEDLRLTYVALTRAKHQAVIWWAGAWEAQHSGLGRLLFSQDDDGSIPPEGGRSVPSDLEVRERFLAMTGSVSVEDATPSALPVTWSPPLEPPTFLTSAVFDRGIDRLWRRTSYSDITAASHELHVASEPETRLIDDEPDTQPLAAPEPSPLADMPGGVHVGTLVHEVFEAVEFDAPDLPAALHAQLHNALRHGTLDIGDVNAVAAGLAAALQTPLGPLLDDLPLSALSRADRVDEMVFELPLATLTPGAIANVLREHDTLTGYAERLRDPELRSGVRGFLTGSIDLVLRAGGRYAIVDYKSNRLADYSQGALRDEMYRAHYALQGLLYTIALHRYLRHRLPNYDPDRDFAGVFYAFVRGMPGPASSGAGVFAWQPPAALVESLSDLLDQGVAA